LPPPPPRRRASPYQNKRRGLLPPVVPIHLVANPPSTAQSGETATRNRGLKEAATAGSSTPARIFGFPSKRSAVRPTADANDAPSPEDRQGAAFARSNRLTDLWIGGMAGGGGASPPATRLSSKPTGCAEGILRGMTIFYSIIDSFHFQN
jgi:hypothetical protein